MLQDQKEDTNDAEVNEEMDTDAREAPVFIKPRRPQVYRNAVITEKERKRMTKIRMTQSYSRKQWRGDGWGIRRTRNM